MVVIISVIDMFCKSMIDFISKKASIASKGKDTHKFYLVENMTIMFILLIIWSFGIMPVNFDSKSIFYGVIIGLLSFVSYLFFLLSLKGENGSANITIYRLNFIVSSILAVILLSEKVTAGKILGTIFCIAAIMMFLNTKGLKKDISMLFSILASITCGIMNLVNKIALDTGVESNTLLFYRYVIVLLATFAYYKMSKIDMKIDLKSSAGLLKSSTAAGVLMLLSLNLLYYALKIGDVSIVTPIVQSCFIFTSVLCFIFLKEKLSVRKIIGIALAVLTILVIGIK